MKASEFCFCFFFSLSLSLPSDETTKIVARNVLSKSIQGYNSSQLASCARSHCLVHKSVPSKKKIKFPGISSAFLFLCIDLYYLWLLPVLPFVSLSNIIMIEHVIDS